jgi:murein L,D-transpeptidase YcbB/YkuD
VERFAVPEPAGEPEAYDPALESAVRRFQTLHGLTDDGVVGLETIAALNVPAATRVRQLAHAAEQRRRLPDSLGRRYILVNVPDFTLQLVEDGRPAFRTRVIVGRPDWPTPGVSSTITELIFRPLWRVPRSIAELEILPLVRRDSTYLRRVAMRVFRDTSANGAEVDPSAVDWAAVSPRSLAYRFVQEPGPENPLGGVKFVLHSPFAVFLHDTPARALFGLRSRALSHGCVRVEGADRLAALLLPEWPLDSIRGAMREGGERERRVRLARPVPVHLVYWTAWLEPDGFVAFRSDLYRLTTRP